MCFYEKQISMHRKNNLTVLHFCIHILSLSNYIISCILFPAVFISSPVRYEGQIVVIFNQHYHLLYSPKAEGRGFKLTQ